MFNSITSRFAIAALVAGFVAAAAPAHAQDSQTSTRMVKIGDLDLHTTAGQSALRHRIHLAANRVCGEPGAFGSADYASYASCVQQAENQAMTRVTAIAAAAPASRYTLASLSN